MNIISQDLLHALTVSDQALRRYRRRLINDLITEQDAIMAKPDTPPGQAQVLHIQNTDPTKPVWTGTKAEYNADKQALKDQGYVMSDDAPDSPPAPTPS